MSDGDVSEVEVVLDGVRFYVEAPRDDTEHEVGSKLTTGLDDQRQRLARLLRRCTVQIQAGGTTGTEFFIAPQQVMTCRRTRIR